MAEASHQPELVVITGMSGAGRSQAIHTFEDLGYFCIDNLPPSFIGQVVALTSLPGSRISRVAVVCDVRSMSFFDEFMAELDLLREQGVVYHLLFLEADDATLLHRFKATRRRHPLSDEAGGIQEAIEAERKELCEIRGHADLVIDTSSMSSQDLRTSIRREFLAENLKESLIVTVSSFGFKYGIPLDADIVMDVRFLPNPYYIDELRDLSGLDEPVRDFVMSRPETAEFLSRWLDLIGSLAPQFLSEGKTYLSIALGCTGGMHRSVVLAEETTEFLRRAGYQVIAQHRDVGKDAVSS